MGSICAAHTRERSKYINIILSFIYFSPFFTTINEIVFVWHFCASELVKQKIFSILKKSIITSTSSATSFSSPSFTCHHLHNIQFHSAIMANIRAKKKSDSIGCYWIYMFRLIFFSLFICNDAGARIKNVKMLCKTRWIEVK